jgi:phage shock protein PspC (stress-responsive transcriptional regulator)
MRASGRDGNLGAMTTTDTTWQPPQPPPPPGNRVLRRSRTDRVGAGVAGGLGQYFNVDPVLFRVLFAVSAFFGGAGVVAYLVAWAAIPEEGTTGAPVDRFINGLRARRVPIWAVAVVVGLVLWGLAFAWWAPGPFFPVLAVIVLLAIVFSRRDWSARGGSGPAPSAVAPSAAGPSAAGPSTADPSTADPAAATAGATPTVSLQKDAPAGSPDWVRSTRAWLDEARAASRERRRRAFPVRIGTIVALVGTLVGLAIADAVSGIRLPVYFWVTLCIVGAGLLAGMVLRRAPWSLSVLLIPALAGTIAFGNTGASLHDGVGQHEWTPIGTAQLQGSYRLAFGQGVLDLRNLGTVDTPRRVQVTMAAGQTRLLLPSGLNATVEANVRMGEIEVDGTTVADTHGGSIQRVNGYDIDHTVLPPSGATGAPVTIVVHLADGQISVRHY